MIDLREYQTNAVAGTRRALKVHRRVLLQLPTGAGKTACASSMINGCVAAGWDIWFLCHRDELVRQTSKTLQRMGIDHGYVAAGYPKDTRHQVLVCMVGTVGRRLEKLKPPKIIFVDEAHHAVAGTWKKILDAFPDALIVGLTATPERLDGRGLDDVFRALVTGPQIRWLMDEGWLCDFKLWSHPAPDLSRIKARGDDYDQGELGKAMSDGKLVGDAVEHYLRLAPGERGVSFCVNVEHALITRDAFRKAGVRCEELDGDTDKDVRRNVLAAFQRGDIDILTSVDLFGEGFDLPEMAVAIFQRPTKSLALALQQAGRTFRPVYADGADLSTAEGRLWGIANGPKPFAYLIDHAGNFGPAGAHGMPDDHRDWTLEGRKKSKSASGGPGAKICANCFGSNPQGIKLCRWCGTQFVLTPRELEVIAGDLVEIEREGARIAQASESAMEADSYEAVVRIFIARKNNNPAAAAEGVWTKRGNQVTEQMFYDACKLVAQERGHKRGWAEYLLRARRERIAKEAKARKEEAA